MAAHAGFQLWTVRRRFGAVLPVFACFFWFLCTLRADIVYLDDDGNIISTEKTEIDKDGNIIVVPAEKVVEEIVTPSSVVEEAIKNADGEHLDLKYAGISVVSVGGVDRIVFSLAPPNAVKLVIPEGVMDINPDAFRECRNLESVVFPNSVSTIPSNAFSYMVNQKLKSAVIPALASIEYRAFYNLPSLESVTLNRDGETAVPPEGGASIGQDAFGWCRKLKQFEFPEGIRSIGKDAFMNCDLLESITLPDGIETIDQGAFSQCFALKTLRLPDSVMTIGMWAFRNCRVLEDFRMPSGPLTLGDGAFGDCYALKHIKLPPIRTSTLPDAFINCEGLETVELPDGITAIDIGAFDYCRELKEITIPEGVETIGDQAFANCRKLERVILPSSLKTIESCAFGWCPALKEIMIPEGVKEIAADAFRETPCQGAVRKLAESRHIKITYAE